MSSTDLSSWILERGLPDVELIDGLVFAAALDAPPPPRSGFAIRPKLSGDDAAAFWAESNYGSSEGMK